MPWFEVMLDRSFSLTQIVRSACNHAWNHKALVCSNPLRDDELQKQDSQYGVASLCVGGGMGTAVVLKAIK